MTFSYACQLVILDDNGRMERVVAAHDVGHAINPKACAGQIEGGVHMGLGYALSENFTSTNGVPDSLLLRDCGILGAKQTPQIDVILIEVPDEVGGYGAKGSRRNRFGSHGGRCGGRAAFLRRHPPLQPADAGFSRGSAFRPEVPKKESDPRRRAVPCDGSHFLKKPVSGIDPSRTGFSLSGFDFVL